MRFGLKVVSRLSGSVAAYHWSKSDRHLNYFNFGFCFVNLPIAYIARISRLPALEVIGSF
jgi:hypothetical protein